jgi:GNAT superfamily N-acetyltransferase
MLAAANLLQEFGVSKLTSYTLVLKRGSCFIPSYFGLIIDDADRALFQLEKYPTNRLFKRKPFGTLRKLAAEDVHRTPNNPDSGVPSIDKMTWGDLLYDKEAKSSHVYVYELDKKIAAFISFKTSKEGVMLIDAVAANKSLHGLGVGAMLVRWAETWARSSDCHSIELWAIEGRMDFYENKGFVRTSQKLDLGGGEIYIRMCREILYNIDILDQ